MSAQWTTTADITAARERFIAAIDGWRAPAAHAVALIARDAPITADSFTLVNTANNVLPAAVLATVVGHSSGSAAHEMTPAQLDEAIALLEPAEACTAYQHPNLWLWRDTVRPAWRADSSQRLLAVFIDEGEDGRGDAAVDALRDAAGLA